MTRHQWIDTGRKDAAREDIWKCVRCGCEGVGWAPGHKPQMYAADVDCDIELCKKIMEE
jgi:hypothetical protein